MSGDERIRIMVYLALCLSENEEVATKFGTDNSRFTAKIS